MNAPGLQQGRHRGLWFEEDILLLDVHCYTSRGYLSFIMSLDIKANQISEDMRAVVDRNWDKITYARQRRRIETLSVDGIPWEIHDIEDPAAREIATAAYLKNRVG